MEKLCLNLRTVLLLSLLFSLLYACKKDNNDDVIPAVTNTLDIKLNYEVDGQPLLSDTLIYSNDAGNNYSVSRLWYYLSRIALVNSDSSLLPIKDYVFVDAFRSTTNEFTISGVPAGHYIGIKFYIGLDSVQNLTNALPATSDNLNMEWPVPMGGGYHFMKFEGHASDSAGNYGFAMHLGRNEYLVESMIWKHIQIVSGRSDISLMMNLNEWFRDPEIYDFNIDGNYSMGVMAAMMKLRNNGVDVFSVQ